MTAFKRILKILIASFVSLDLIFTIIFYFNPVGLTWLTSQFTKNTVQSRLDQYGNDVDQRLKPIFEKNDVSYPPQKVKLVFFKDEKTLSLYAGNSNLDLKLIKTYLVKAASGFDGPKLQEGDHQVPEGLYKIESMNPNSLYHLSLRVNYPKDFDKQKAKLDGRSRLGGNID